MAVVLNGCSLLIALFFSVKRKPGSISLRMRIDGKEAYNPLSLNLSLNIFAVSSFPNLFFCLLQNLDFFF